MLQLSAERSHEQGILFLSRTPRLEDVSIQYYVGHEVYYAFIPSLIYSSEIALVMSVNMSFSS